MADRLVELTPDSVSYHQKRVELAYRAGDRGPLLEAYLGLGDALAKSGALDKAIAVYGRVIEHDPNHVRAAAALERLGVPRRGQARSPAPTEARGAAASPLPSLKVRPQRPPSRRPHLPRRRRRRPRPKPAAAAVIAAAGSPQAGAQHRATAGRRGRPPGISWISARWCSRRKSSGIPGCG